MKLHLGCGQKYLEGYMNIDFPESEHTLQKLNVADQVADITKLFFERDSIDEVRLHHVFEHFRRPEAAAMVATWNTWLKNNGKVILEVPDLKAISKIICNPFASIKSIAIAERHLFGSHEASWAAHYEGYSVNLLKLLFSTFGFNIKKVSYSSWRGTKNIHIEAMKVFSIESKATATDLAEKYFEYFILPNSSDELILLDLWKKNFSQQLECGWPRP
jgi:hypothetical protein